MSVKRLIHTLLCPLSLLNFFRQHKHSRLWIWQVNSQSLLLCICRVETNRSNSMEQLICRNWIPGYSSVLSPSQGENDVLVTGIFCIFYTIQTKVLSFEGCSRCKYVTVQPVTSGHTNEHTCINLFANPDFTTFSARLGCINFTQGNINEYQSFSWKTLTIGQMC
jgi:hypothetical protein